MPASVDRYVIILGQVFRWEEKAPFVPSGKSVQGALEYDRENEMVKCHECGVFVKSIGTHLRRNPLHSQTINPREYRKRHGLRMASPICAPLTSKKIKANLSDTSLAYPKMLPFSRADAKSRGWIQQRRKEAAIPRSSSDERRNLFGHCRAQISAKLKEIAVNLGRSPLASEVPSDIVVAAKSHFVSWTIALVENSLQPNNPSSLRPKISEQVLADCLRDFYVLNRRLPRQKEFGPSRGRLPSYCVYRRHFGSLANAFKAAGLLLVANNQTEKTAA